MSERVEIRLEVDRESDPIVGLVHDRRGNRRDFRGWVQLMAAVDAARSLPAREARRGPSKGPGANERRR